MPEMIYLIRRRWFVPNWRWLMEFAREYPRLYELLTWIEYRKVDAGMTVCTRDDIHA